MQVCAGSVLQQLLALMRLPGAVDEPGAAISIVNQMMNVILTRLDMTPGEAVSGR